MKFLKYFLVLFVVIFIGTSNANAYMAEDMYNHYCPQKPYDIANPVSRGLQTVSGVNFMASKIAEKEVKKAIAPFAKGDIKVKVKSYSATDAKQGKFKSFSIKGKNVSLYSVPISEIEIQSVCNFIHLDLNSNPIKLKQPMALDFAVKFSENDLNNLIQSNMYNNYFVNLKYKSAELKLLELQRPIISLKNNKFNFKMAIKTPFLSFIYNIQSNLKVANNRIIISNIYTGSNSKLLNISSLKYMTNVINPLDFIQIILEEHNCKILLKSVKIENEKIVVSGSVFLGKS